MYLPYIPMKGSVAKKLSRSFVESMLSSQKLFLIRASTILELTTGHSNAPWSMEHIAYQLFFFFAMALTGRVHLFIYLFIYLNFIYLFIYLFILFVVN